MSEANQQDSERNKRFFQVRWPSGSPTREEFLMTLPARRSLKDWESTILNGEESSTWDTLEVRHENGSPPNTPTPSSRWKSRTWTVDAGSNTTRTASTTRRPKSGRIPDFDPSKLRETQHPDPLELNTPIIQVPTLQDVLQAVLLEVEQYHLGHGGRPTPRRRVALTMTDPYQSVESDHPP